ncbi:IclR family transcriptional regulator [Amycolatopsis jiangsuensis]|uniref:Glycerol operon regulatory protein n=1 Tax=Amycolatopsis jiangsuensis TaxID=1181879 RepID=A0A840IMA8_9PSEU|nr:IclR family transcriptional regulator [Amycolatopsis jiangsuensis]MBB4683466.1 DNA-binding IclR family transcriptional regulator [Amycolatopsis jiangsuensis]
MIQSVDRALRILNALQSARRLSLRELAGRLELAPSTAHGIVRTLVTHGMVVQERDSQQYRLGPATLRLGNTYLGTLELRARASGWAEDLAERTGFAVRTAVRLLDDVLVVHHARRPDGSLQMDEVGIVIPAHACALGKVLLAFGSDDREPARLHSMTGHTLTDATALRSQLETVRRGALAEEVEEAVIGECGVATPVFDATGDAVGALGLVVPSTEWPLEPATADALRTAARAVCRELGGPAQAIPG